jgi:xanthine/CO dehydrogenase XdhC/CoxF family maturation factor
MVEIGSAGAMQEHDEVLERLRSWQDAGHRVAVATVVNTWGSSPRPVGSQLGVNDKGEMVGSVSGGCIEGAVVKEALEVMAGAPPKLLDYGVSNEQAWEVGLACGGKLEVYIEAVD